MKNIFKKSIVTLLCTLFAFSNTQTKAQDNYDATTMGEKVYLETANWGQNSPFNKQIFTSYGGSTNAKAGCVPTAYAIVMRYHGFPEEGTAKTLYNCQAPTYVEITDRVYDFSKMPLTYNSNWTQEQIDEVSKFFSHVLHACFPSKISTGSTEVNEGQTSKVLNDYFNYQLINASYQANFTMEQWIEKIKESIDNGCPIPYASDNSGTGDTRHMFVVDGYTANNYFHFNFGWSGSGNGWFKLDNITPSQGDNYSWIDGAEHYALFNLAPNRTLRTVTASVSPAGAGTVTVNGSANSAEVMEGITATLVATANSGYTFSHWSKDGTEVGTDMTYRAKVAAEGNEYVANFYTIGSSVNIPVNYDSNMGSVTYNGNIVSATGFNPNEYSEVTLTAEANDGYMFTGWEIVEGTETTESNDNTVTFIAKSGITVKANFALAGGEYKINNSNITPSGGNNSYCPTWTYSKAGDIEEILTLSTKSGSTAVNALSKTSNRLYAHAYDDNSNGYREITYTLTAKEGFVITGYSLTYVVSKAGQVTVRNATQTQTPSDTQQYTLTYQYANAARSTAYGTRSTDFVLSSTTASTSQYITIKDLSVTVLSEGGEGGGTTDPDTPTTPTTYTISVSATEGGSAYVGTGTSTTVTAGNSVMLTATTNNGYTFDGWYNGTTRVSTSLQYTFTPTASGTYQAKFTANATPEQPSTGTNLAGKYFRLKTTVNGAAKYMNVGTQSDNSHGNVNMVDFNETSNDQIFLFVQSGDGYKLQAKSGNYVKCAEWNVNANTTNADEASVLLFEESGDGYLIKWNNTYKNGGTIKYFNIQTANAGDRALHPYSDGDKTSAAVWVLEEVVEAEPETPTNEKTLNVTFDNATYTKTDGTELTSGWGYQVVTQTTPAVTIKVAENKNNFGYTTGVISGVKTPYLYKSTNFILSVPEPYKITGYKMTVKGQDGNYSGDVTCTVDGTETSKATLSGTTTQTLSATGLNTSTVNIGVGGNAGNGIFITALEIYYTGEEVEEPEETELFPDGAYKIYWEQNNRGYLAYHNGTWPNEAVLADVTLSNYGSSHYNSTTDPVDLVWYLITADDGKRYLFEAETGKFLGVNTGLSTGGGKANKLSTTEAWPIAIEENTKHAGYYIITTMIDNTNNLLCSGCGSSSKNGAHPVRWLTVNDNNQNDGGAPLKLVKVDNVTVAKDVMSMVKSVINNSGNVPFKVEIEGLRENDPNTHFATVTVGGTTVKLAPAHLTQSEIEATLVAGSTLAINHKYRGFEFNGFYIGEESLGESATLTAEQIAAISATTPLVAKFTATNTGEATLFSAEDEFSYRIPAIVKTSTGRLIAVSDYRHNLDDIGRDKHGTGKMRIDLVARMSDNNGETWTAKQTIAAGDESKVGSYQRAYGDAAIAAVGENIIVMAAAGDVMYSSASATNTNKMVRVFSSDNGANWTIEDMTTKMYSTSTSLFPNHFSAFFGSGKLAVDNNFNGTNNARIYGALLMKNSSSNYNNFVVYSDDLGANWHILGGSQDAIAGGDEPKVEILPSGQILLSARRQGGRIFRVFTYGTDKANGEGSWGDAAVNGCDNGGSNGTNGEIICLDAKKPNGKATKILLQSQPKGGSGHYERYNVTIWYKEITDEAQTPSSIANGWTQGLEVCPAGIKSAYSAMALQENGEIAFFFEEAPCYADNHEKGYSMVYVPLTIEEITNNNFLNPNAVVKTVTVDVTLTDNEGNTYTHQFDYMPGDAAAIDAALKAAYPFITELGEGNLQGSDTYYTYTNTVTLPFKVSNANTTVWHNIYWPANTRESDYPVYLSASSKDDTYVPKVTGSYAYGNHPTYNTLDGNEKISWAIYNINNGFEFIFKNKVTDKYIQVTDVATGNAQNVVYVENAENATAFTIFNKPAGNDYYTPAQYALAAKVGETTGYLCSTSATGYNYATHYNSNGHQGAWIEFKEAPDYQGIYDKLIADINNFGDGEGKYKDDNTISGINKDALRTMLFSDLTAQATAVQTVKDRYTEITLTVPAVNDVVPGSVKILNEPVSHKFVPKGEITIEAVHAAGYRFVNWTRPAAQASAAARTAEARNSEFVSDQNPYTVTVSEALSLEANFEQIVVTATLTDAQGNTYKVELRDFAGEITTDAVAAKLVALYPYITLGTEATAITLEGNGAAYTYKNTVELPFKVSNATYLWHNIYWPSNTRDNDYPVYLSASSAEDTYVPKVTGNYAYGDHPTYNTKNGNNNISWAIYNVNNSFEFIFKNKVTQKYIKVSNVADGNAQNVEYVENAEEATAFTIEVKPAGDDYWTDAEYALAAKVGETKGYLCSTSAGYGWATHYYNSSNNGYGHQGAWVKFVEAPDYFTMIQDLGIVLGLKFGAGNGKCVIAGTNIEEVNSAMQNSGSITLNNLIDYAARMEAAMATENPTWFDVTTSAENGTAYIILENDDPELYSKRVPGGYELTVKATPATGYHFIGWTINGTAVEGTTEEHTFTVTGETTIVANFEINTYTVNVTAGDGGSVTVAPETVNGTTVDFATVIEIKATPNDGYKFIGWYNGDELQHSINPHEFAINHDINYQARFEKNEAGSTTNTYVIKIDAILTDGETATNNATGNVQAIIHGIGLDWATSAEVVENATVELVAISDHNQSAYLFEGWYKNGELVSTALNYKVAVTETVIYEARFAKGKVIKLTSNNKSLCLPNMPTYTDGSEVAGTITDLRAVVREGEELLISIDDSVIAYFTGEGYRVANWTDKDGNEVAGKNVYSFTITVNGDNTYKVNLEKDTYTLTVSTEGTMGTVHIGDGTETSVTVNNGGTAKITATPNSGYKFVNWTLNGVVVSTENPYNVPAITDNVQYVAVFAEATALNAGYYRIAYDFPETATNAPAARAGATRAAGEVVSIDLTTGEFKGIKEESKGTCSQWASNNGVSIIARDPSGNEATSMRYYSNNFQLHLISGVTTPVEYTITVPTGYTLKEMKYKNASRTNDMTVSYNSTDIPLKNVSSEQTITFVEGVTSFKLSGTIGKYIYITGLTMTKNAEGGESGGTTPTPEPDTETVRYYMQSEAVNATNNALIMRNEDDENYDYASSIFYYADSKLLSYDKGTYLKENSAGARGLQEVGVYGDVEIKIVDTNENEENICTIKAPSYLHAMNGSTYYVDHCGSNEGTNAHANHNFTIVEVDKLPVSIGTALYATFYAPVAVAIPEGVKAYVLKEENITVGSYVIMTLLSEGVIPANTGVILKREDESNETKKYDFEIVAPEEVSEDAKEDADGNVLSGTVAKTKITEDAYILANRNGKIGLYPVAKNSYLNGSVDGVRFTNNSHKAYLPVKDNFAQLLQQSNGFHFVFDDDATTEIEDIEAEIEDTIYDLQGRKLSEITQPGIYIVNGKKIFVK